MRQRNILKQKVAELEQKEEKFKICHLQPHVVTLVLHVVTNHALML